jgi:hypothetical protein
MDNEDGKKIVRPATRIVPAFPRRRIVKSHFAMRQQVVIEKRLASTGELLSRQEGSNAVTKAGVALLLKSTLAGQAEIGEFWSHIGVGSDGTTPTIFDAALGAEVARGAFTSVDTAGLADDDPWFEVYKLFGPDEANGSLQECAIFNNVLDVMLARYTFATEVVTSDHTFGVRYRILTVLNVEIAEESPESSP